jgi:hypothetical protein
MWSEFAKERRGTGVVSLWNTLMDPSWRVLIALEKTDSASWICFRPCDTLLIWGNIYENLENNKL